MPVLLAESIPIGRLYPAIAEMQAGYGAAWAAANLFKFTSQRRLRKQPDLDDSSFVLGSAISLGVIKMWTRWKLLQLFLQLVHDGSNRDEFLFHLANLYA